jgi:hypothetical protein
VGPVCFWIFPAEVSVWGCVLGFWIVAEARRPRQRLAVNHAERDAREPAVRALALEGRLPIRPMGQPGPPEAMGDLVSRLAAGCPDASRGEGARRSRSRFLPPKPPGCRCATR